MLVAVKYNWYTGHIGQRIPEQERGRESPVKDYTPPKKPLIYYYLIGMLILMILNVLFFPQILSAQVEEVSYGTFLTMVDEGNVTQVEINQMRLSLPTTADPTRYYKTGPMYDPGLTDPAL